MRALNALAAVFCALAAGVLCAQQPAAGLEPVPEALIRVGAQEVLLDLVVRDRKGRLIRNLKAEEIEVYEEGQRQRLTAFRLVSGGTVGGEAGAQAADTRPLLERRADELYDPRHQPRLVSLVFEGLDTEARRLARQACEELLQGDLGPNTHLAVFVIDPQLRVLQPFTLSRDLAREAVEAATGAPFTEYVAAAEEVRAQLESAESSQTLIQNAVATSSPGRGGGGDAVGAGAAAAQMGQMTLNMLRVEERLTRTQQGRSSLLSLLSLVQAQTAFRGRKTLIFFSRGLNVPENLVPYFRDAIGTANRAGVSVYSVDARGLTLDTQNASGTAMLQSAIQSSRRQQTVDGAAVTADQVRVFDTAMDSIHANSQRVLEDLSSATGGFLIANTNNFRAPFERIVEDINTYYEVSYRPKIEEYDGSFRNITVKISRPKVNVQTRSGYFALPPGESSALAYETPLLQALSSSPLPSEFPFHAAALRFGQETDKLQYALVVEVPLERFTFISDREGDRLRARISILAVLKDVEGQIVQRFSRDLGLFAEPSELESFQKRNFVQTYPLTLAPGRYRLETAVMDRESQRLSANRAWVVAVPPSAGVSVSSVVLVRRTEPWATEMERGSPFDFDGKRVVPTLDHTVRPETGGGLSFYVVVYPADSIPDSPSLVLEFFRDGKEVGKAAPKLPKPESGGMIPYVASLPLENFAIGQYELRVVAVQGQTMSEQMISFSIDH